MRAGLELVAKVHKAPHDLLVTATDLGLCIRGGRTEAWEGRGPAPRGEDLKARS